MTTTKTTNVRIWGGAFRAYAERSNDAIIVRVYDPIAGHYTTCHSLTPGQVRHVISRTLWHP